MADQYLKALNFAENSQKKTIAGMNVEADTFIELVRDMTGQRMSDNDYAKVLEMFYKRYSRKNDRPLAVNYCVMQMERLYQARTRKNLQAMYPAIDFSENAAPFFKEFVSDTDGLYPRMEETVMKKWLAAQSVTSIALLAFFVLLCRLPFLVSLLICILLFVLLWIVGRRYIAPSLAEDRMNRMIRSLEPDHQEFERQMLILPPKPFAF
ncbi:MAG: hypothetical protein HUJ54_03995 [Erysipelotrichaceae bacterium]|nr:hypothetical protein [Erysipelotrichaceae bacterium]